MMPDEVAYLRALAGAEGHITGRFHGICLSMLTETPFLAVASKTSKIETLLKDAGLGHDRLIGLEELSKNPQVPVKSFATEELARIREFRQKGVDGAKNLFERICALA